MNNKRKFTLSCIKKVNGLDKGGHGPPLFYVTLCVVFFCIFATNYYG